MRAPAPGVLFRLLALSLAIAGCAIAATAWLTRRDTSHQLKDTIERTLEGDATIYQALLGFADSQPTWEGVGELVGQLAGKTGQRIALTTKDGQVLADSAGAGPDRPALPRTPTAVVDPFAPALNLLPADLSANAPGEVVGAGLSEPERERRRLLARQAAACLVRLGYPAAVTDDPLGAPQVVAKRVPDKLVAECVPEELGLPSTREASLAATIKMAVADCIQTAGDQTPVDRDRDVSAALVAKCQAVADRQVRDPYVADPALLFLGTGPDRFQGVWETDRPRTVATVVAILLATAVVTVLAGRRLVRPIHALTAAVRRMEAGDRSARVPGRGRRDEVGRLGHAFNSMAAAMEENEAQRQAMVSDIAHELRNPLANVRGYLEGAQDGVVPLDEALVASLLEESTLLSHLVDDLQDLALADAGRLPLHPELLDATELVEQAVTAHRAAAGAAGVVLAAETAGPVPVTGDPARLRQALGNLVGNALRYTPAGGRVTVGAAPAAEGGGATLTVGDTGVGIAAEHLPHIFDRFYRADPSRSRQTGGSGLGLAITRKLVEAHGGTISAESTEGAGSTFTIRLPG